MLGLTPQMLKKIKNLREQNFEDEANNMQLDKEDTRQSNSKRNSSDNIPILLFVIAFSKLTSKLRFDIAAGSPSSLAALVSPRVQHKNISLLHIILFAIFMRDHCKFIPKQLEFSTSDRCDHLLVHSSNERALICWAACYYPNKVYCKELRQNA